jgi:hypothetical protein
MPAAREFPNANVIGEDDDDTGSLGWRIGGVGLGQ